MADDLLAAAQALQELAEKAKAADQLVATSVADGEAATAKEEATDLAIDFIDTTTNNAKPSVNDASTLTGQSLSTANNDKGNIYEAAGFDENGVAYEKYDDEASASTAKAAAIETIGVSEQNLENSKNAVAVAEAKLGEAEKAKQAAGDALKEASDLRDKAIEERATARSAFIKLLEENGLGYTEAEDGTISATWDERDLKGSIMRALENAQNAVNKAEANFTKADTEFNTANGAAINALLDVTVTSKAAYTAAKEQSDKYSDTQKEYLDNLLKDKDTEGSIAYLKDKIDTSNSTNFYNTNMNLAGSIVQYMLAQMEGIDPSTIKVTTDNNGNVKKIDNKGFEVSYKDPATGETVYEYYNYKAYDNIGWEIGQKNPDIKASDHIVIVKLVVTKRDENGKAKAYGDDKKATYFASEKVVLTDKSDAYQTSNAALNKTEEAYRNAYQEAKSALGAAMPSDNVDSEIDPDGVSGDGTYMDVGKAKEKEAAAKEALEADAFTAVDRLDKLIEAIQAQQKKVSEAKTSDYWSQNRVLTNLMVEYMLIQELKIEDPSKFKVKFTTAKGNSTWVANNGNINHYTIANVYLMDENGKWVKQPGDRFFDYLAYYTNGEIGNGDGSYNDIKYSSMSNSESGYVPDHIKVVEKQLLLDENGNPKKDKNGNPLFKSKGEKYFDEADFNNGADDYQKNKKNHEDLEKAYAAAQTAVTVAETLNTLKEEQTKADKLKTKVASAQQDVLDARNALIEAHTKLDVSQSRIKELEEKLEAANARYDAVSRQLQAAKDNVTEIEGAIEAMNIYVRDGFKWKTASPSEPTPGETPDTPAPEEDDPAPGRGHHGHRGGGGDEGGGDDVSAPAVADAGAAPAAVTPTPVSDTFTVPLDGALTDGAGAVAAGGGAIDTGVALPAAGGDTIEAGVLGDGLEPMGDVLGERMAPIVEAVENGNFNRGMMFTEAGLKLPFMWWLIVLILGAKGVDMYLKKKKEEEAAK